MPVIDMCAMQWSGELGSARTCTVLRAEEARDNEEKMKYKKVLTCGSTVIWVWRQVPGGPERSWQTLSFVSQFSAATTVNLLLQSVHGLRKTSGPSRVTALSLWISWAEHVLCSAARSWAKSDTLPRHWDLSAHPCAFRASGTLAWEQ